MCIRKLILILSLGTALSVQAAEFPVSVNQGVTFNQLDFPDNNSPQLNSAVGLMEVNLLRLRNSIALASGYLNVVLAGEWVVRNFPVFAETDYPYSHLSTRFDLGVNEGTDVSTLAATVIYGDTVLTAAPAESASSFPVASFTISQGGITDQNGNRGTRGSTSPPSLNDVLFGDPIDTRAIFQLDHPNIEAANNQCYPMAVANSLQFLANTTDLNLPHSHVAGIRGDNSLVGQIGAAMNRTVVSRSNGQGVNDTPGLRGKLQYLAANGLQDRVQTRHWGRYISTNNVSVTVGGKTASSTAMGQSINFDLVVSALEGGEDCEAAYTFAGGGGHAIDLVAAGYTNGQPWMIESSDIDQSSDSKGAGPRGFEFSYLKDTNMNGDFNLSGSGTELDMMICQKYIPPAEPTGTVIPPPETAISLPGVDLNLLGTNDPSNHSCCVTPPPGAVDVNVTGNTISLDTGGIPWLPFSFDVQEDGTFSSTNTTTVAGFSNVTNSISGSVQADKLIVEVSLGSAGGLPGGDPIIYSLEVAPDDPWPWASSVGPGELRPAIRANGFRDNLTLAQGEPFSLGVSLDPEPASGPAELWVVAQAGDQIFSFDAASSVWMPGILPAATSEFMPIDNQIMFSSPDGLPPGGYTFYFGVDDAPNGQIDEATLVFDSLLVTVP